MALVAIMRQNARFRADGGGEHPLVGGLNGVRLHRKQPAASKRADYIAPFVDLITSPEAPGPITGAALVTVDRLLREGVVEDVDDLALVLRGVLACRFEQSDAVEDEKVLATMFGVLESASDLPMIRQIPAPLIGEMLGALRKYAKEARFSVLLRACALASLRKTVNSLTRLLTESGARDRDGEIMCTLLSTLVGVLQEEDEGDLQAVALSAIHTALSYLAAAAAEESAPTGSRPAGLYPADDAGGNLGFPPLLQQPPAGDRGAGVGCGARSTDVALTKFVTESVAPALVTLAVNPATTPPLLARALNALVLVYRYARNKEGGGLPVGHSAQSAMGGDGRTGARVGGGHAEKCHGDHGAARLFGGLARADAVRRAGTRSRAARALRSRARRVPAAGSVRQLRLLDDVAEPV